MSRNRNRTKDPRGGWRVGKSYKRDTNKVYRHLPVEEPEVLPHRKKRGKRTKWCGGSEGREHILTAESRVDYGIVRKWVWVCSRCHKIVDTWYPRYWRIPDLRERPSWLPYRAPGGRRD